MLKRGVLPEEVLEEVVFDPISGHAGNSGHGSMFGLICGHDIGRVSMFGLIYMRPVVGGLSIDMTLPSRHADT
jgi:hypothetical protein